VLAGQVRKVLLGAGQYDLPVPDENAVNIAFVASLIVRLPHKTEPLTLK
jgi:hypothetical protein